MRYWRDHKYFSWRTKFHCGSWGNQFRNEFFFTKKDRTSGERTVSEI